MSMRNVEQCVCVHTSFLEIPLVGTWVTLYDMHFLNESMRIKMIKMVEMVEMIKIIKMIRILRVMIISVKILTMWNDQRCVLHGDYISRHRSHTSIQTYFLQKVCRDDEYLDQDMTWGMSMCLCLSQFLCLWGLEWDNQTIWSTSCQHFIGNSVLNITISLHHHYHHLHCGRDWIRDGLAAP